MLFWVKIFAYQELCIYKISSSVAEVRSLLTEGSELLKVSKNDTLCDQFADRNNHVSLILNKNQKELQKALGSYLKENDLSKTMCSVTSSFYFFLILY